MSLLRLYLVGGVVIVAWLGVFLWVFTGDCTSTKNRVAIGFSYIQVLIALIVPFLLVDALASNPTALDYMKRAPIGICLANINNHPQWVLNIGGQVPTEPGEGLAEHGLIVPLYVIVLAFVGGAINLTRQVPRFQPESERREAQTATLLPYGERRKVKRFDRRRTNWRTGLLTHYMYLASAPFLAIAAYYLLVWTGVDSKLPIVVLVAFAVGITSDPVLKKITDVGYGFLRHKQPTPEVAEIREIPAIGQNQTERKPPTATASGM
jgi:hypothetical protein